MLLLVPAGQALLIAGMLAARRAGQPANRRLALLLLVLAGLLVPYIIGYAGFYDRYPWLSYAPFAVPLAVGPLFYAYLRALAAGERVAAWHWIAPVVQFLNQALVFPWPLATKNWFDSEIQAPLISPVAQAALIVSLAGYGIASLRLVRHYRSRAGNGSAAARRIGRLQMLLTILAVLIIARTGLTIYDQLITTDYFDRFPYYVLLALLTAWLAIEGWRHADDPFPPPAPERDWRALGEEWVGRLDAEQWWRDPELSLDELARRLGTNSSHASRALNAAGGGFAEIVASRRAEEVARRLDNGDQGDLLTIALEAGFGSKASFNRAFRQRFAMSPSDYRRRLNGRI